MGAIFKAAQALRHITAIAAFGWFWIFVLATLVAFWAVIYGAISGNLRLAAFASLATSVFILAAILAFRRWM